MPAKGELYDSVVPLLPPFALQLSRMEPLKMLGDHSICRPRATVVSSKEFFVVLSHYVMAGDVLLIQSVTSAGRVAHAPYQHRIPAMVAAGHEGRSAPLKEPINEEGYEPRIELCNGPDAGVPVKKPLGP